MNPELQRNLWLELTPRRLLLMAGLLALGFFAAALPGTEYGLPALARWLYYMIAILWGTRNAALSVVGEIRDRTWDAQRLSSLSPSAMTWGKLFGSTAYNWFGGVLCLAVPLAHMGTQEGPYTAALEGIYLVAMGVLAQAAALLASLVGIRRRKTTTRLDISLYQGVGILVAFAVAYIWDRADIIAAFSSASAPDQIVWWRIIFDARVFLMVSLAIFAGWTLLGCYRLMRLELKVENGPLVWAGFLVFAGLYAAGFDAWLENGKIGSIDGEGPLRLCLAAFVFACLAYAMVFLEPKDNVHYRWMAGQVRKGDLTKFASGLHGWMMSYAAAILCGLVLIVWLGQIADPRSSLLVLSVMGFMTRDVGLVLLMSMRGGNRRGDFAAFALLAALYVPAPMIVENFGLSYLFLPTDKMPLMASVAAWAEAVGVVVLVAARLARMKDGAA